MQDIHKQLLELIAQINPEADYSDVGIDDQLNLDSIQRITLMADLENAFEIELDAEEVQPEVFDTLASLAGFVEKAVA